MSYKKYSKSEAAKALRKNVAKSSRKMPLERLRSDAYGETT